MSGMDGMMGKMSLGSGGRVQRGGKALRSGQRGSRVQGGWSGSRGAGLKRGGGWNRFENSESTSEIGSDRNDRSDNFGGARLSGPGNINYNLNYIDSSEKKNEVVSRQGVRPQEEMLNGSTQQKKKNTETFKPCHDPSEMRMLFSYGVSRYQRPIQTRDVLCVPDLFCSPSDLTLYNQLHSELQNSGLTSHQIWASWHGDSHLIANDKMEWSKHCPTFHMVLDKIRDYFDMKISATRLNWYRDSTEWKPFHHDASAIKEDKAKLANLTVAVSFGLEREAAFEHAKTKTVVSMPCPNGSMYVFARDINVLWRHGILQIDPNRKVNEGRISVIAWGWTNQVES